MSKPVLRIRSIFFGSGSGLKNSDPYLDPDPTYIDMFLMLSKMKSFNGIFLPINILWQLKSKIKKVILTKLYFRQFYKSRKLQGSFCGKGSWSGFSRIRIRVTQKDRIRPDLDPQHWSKLLFRRRETGELWKEKSKKPCCKLYNKE